MTRLIEVAPGKFYRADQINYVMALDATPEDGIVGSPARPPRVRLSSPWLEILCESYESAVKLAKWIADMVVVRTHEFGPL